MDFQQFLKTLSNDDDAVGNALNDPGLKQLLNLLADERGNNTDVRLADNIGIEKKVTKAPKDFSAYKLSFVGDKSGKSKEKTFALMKEKARALAARSKYYESTALMEDVGVDEGVDLGTNLLLAVCYLQLGRENKANKSIKSMRRALLENPTLEADEVLDMIDSLVESNSHTAALILLPVARELYKRLTSADEVLDGLFRCIQKANDCTVPMIPESGRARILAIDFGMDFMVETLDELKTLEGADPQKRAFKQSLAINLIAYEYWVLKDNLKGVRLREEAVEAMDKAFGHANAKRRRIYGSSLYNIGVGYDILSKHSLAQDAYERAIDAIECATDYDEESRREKDAKQCKQKLRELHG